MKYIVAERDRKKMKFYLKTSRFSFLGFIVLLIAAVICNKQIGEESVEFYTLSVLSLILIVINIHYQQKVRDFECSKCSKAVFDPYVHKFFTKIPDECFSCKVWSEHEQTLKERDENG